MSRNRKKNKKKKKRKRKLTFLEDVVLGFYLRLKYCKNPIASIAEALEVSKKKVRRAKRRALLKLFVPLRESLNFRLGSD